MISVLLNKTWGSRSAAALFVGFVLQMIALLCLSACTSGAILDRVMEIEVVSVTAAIVSPTQDLQTPAKTAKMSSGPRAGGVEVKAGGDVIVRAQLKAVKAEAFDPTVKVVIQDSRSAEVLAEKLFDRLDFLRDFDSGVSLEVMVKAASCRSLRVTLVIGFQKPNEYLFPSVCSSSD